jgi:hypothetical protein
MMGSEWSGLLEVLLAQEGEQNSEPALGRA